MDHAHRFGFIYSSFETSFYLHHNIMKVNGILFEMLTTLTVLCWVHFRYPQSSLHDFIPVEETQKIFTLQVFHFLCFFHTCSLCVFGGTCCSLPTMPKTKLVSVLIRAIWNGTVLENHCVTADCMTVRVCGEILLQMDNKAICFWIL